MFFGKGADEMNEPTADLSPLRRLARADEVVEATGISKPRLYELCRRGQIPHIKLGRSVRFDVRAVAGWLAAGGTSENRT